MAEIQSLARGLKILNLLEQSQEGVSVTELAEKLGVDKGSASRLVATLAHYGFAEKDESTRRYRLGPQLLALSRNLLMRLPLREAAKPFLHQLMERSGECAHLAVPAQGEVLYIDQVESPASLRVDAQVGQLNPLYCTALGKAMLAFGKLDVPMRLEAFTPHTITDLRDLHRQLDEIRRLGYAFDDEELNLGVRCIAAPIFEPSGKLVGSIGISGPTARMTLERCPALSAMVVEVSNALSESMTLTR